MALPDPRHFDPGYQIDILYTENGVRKRIRAFANTINWLRVDGLGIIESPPAPQSQPLNILPPAISGETLVGFALFSFKGLWAGVPDPTYTYQWLANDVAIPGATSTSYVPTVADVGKTIKLRVTAQNIIGSAVATSLPTIPVTAADPPVIPGNTGLPTIDGNATVGEILVSETGTWTGTEPITYTYQWKANGVALVGATDSTYLLTADEESDVITLTVTATNAAGSAEATSDGTEPVAGVGIPIGLPANIGAPGITGTAQIGGTLTLDRGSWTNEPTLAQQWYANGFAIHGATGLTYALTEDDRAKRISAVVTATNSAGSASASAPQTGVVAAVAAVTKRYIRRVSSGTGTGDSWANAAALSSINAMIVACGGYGEILIRSDEGTYSAATFTLTALPPATRVLIRGADVNELPANATIVGNRTDPFISNGVNTTGQEVFRLSQGVGNLTFRNIEFRRCGNGCFRLGGDVTGLVIEECVADNVNRFIENNITGVATAASLTNSRIGHCTARGFSRAFARLRYASANVHIHDCFGDSEQQDGDNFAAGITLSDTANSFRFDRVTMINTIETNLGDQLQYWNGDSFSQENGNHSNVYTDCFAKGATDAGFDLKGGCTLIRCVAAENKKNFRLWGPAVLTDCVSRDPYRRGGTGESNHMHLPSALSNVTVNNMAFVDTRPETAVFEINEASAILTFNSGSLQRHADSTLVINPNGAPFDASNLTTTPPNATTLPAINGSPAAETTLSVTTGSWSGSGLTFTYQWCRDNLYIDDATDDSYLLGSADVGKAITCRVFAKNAAGHMGEAITLPTALVSASPPVNTVLPSISGVPAVDAFLLSNVGTWSGAPAPAFTYHWRRNGVNIGLATESSYQLQAADEGATIDLVVTGTNSSGSASATTAATGVIGASVSEVFVAPVAAGNASGSSFANAIAFTSIPNTLAAMAPGGIINVAAHLGTYVLTGGVSININHGGTAGNRVIIRGVDADLNPAKPTIVGTRTNWTPPANEETVTNVNSWTVGNDVFNVNANHVEFRHFHFQNVGTCFDLNISSVDDIVMGDWTFQNIREGVFTNNFAPTNILIERFAGVGFSKRVVRFFNDSHDWIIRDFSIDSRRQDKDDFAIGIACNDTAHDLLIQGTVPGGLYDGVIKNCHDSTGGYWNGDGITTERDNAGITIERVTSRGHTDGGIDSKAPGTIITDCICIDNKKNFRIWSDTGAVYTGCVSEAPFKRGGSSGTAHMHIIGGDNPSDTSGPDVTVKQCTFNGTGSAFSMIDVNIYNTILRSVGNTFNGVADNSLPFNSRKIVGAVGDVTAPVISTGAAFDTFNRQQFLTTLAANEDVSWAIVGGADQAKFDIVDTSGNVCKTGAILRMDKTTWTGSDDSYEVQIQAKDANGNTANKTITVTVLEALPQPVFQTFFEGIDNQTTPIADDIAAKIISLSSGAKLTGTDPLQGVTSLLITGGQQRASTPDHADFHFGGGEFSIEALIRPTSLPAAGAAGGIVSQMAANTDRRSFRFNIGSTGTLSFLWSDDGDDATSVSSAAGLIAPNVTYRVLIDRDETKRFRLYIDGVMVATTSSTQALHDSNVAIQFGNSGHTFGEPFAGRIDSVRIWKGFALAGSDAGYTP